jgi:hypothetical protein
MTAAPASSRERRDLRTILTAGILLGVFAALGVAVFSLLSRVLSGGVEMVIRWLIALVGLAVAAFLPGRLLRPNTVDGIAWATLAGFLGAVIFTVLDIALLRPLGLYSWKWDAVGGGSGWWYVPIWWMGSALLAWLGSWAYSVGSSRR